MSISPAQGWVAEGTTSNVFWMEGGRLQTPALQTGILGGVTRGLVIELCERELGIPCDEVRVSPKFIYGAREAFLTNSSSGILPIRYLDRRHYGNPGPGTRRLGEALEAFRLRWCERRGQRR